MALRINPVSNSVFVCIGIVGDWAGLFVDVHATSFGVSSSADEFQYKGSCEHTRSVL